MSGIDPGGFREKPSYLRPGANGGTSAWRSALDARLGR